MLAAGKLALIGFSLFALTSITFSNLAHAALFDDKEARKKIAEVDAKQQVNIAAIAELKKTTAAMDKRIAAIEAIVQGGGLADMQNQIVALKQEVANLKGDLELAQHNLDNTQQRQKDLYTDTDTRLRRIEGSVTTGANATNSTVPTASENGAAGSVAHLRQRNTCRGRHCRRACPRQLRRSRSWTGDAGVVARARDDRRPPLRGRPRRARAR